MSSARVRHTLNFEGAPHGDNGERISSGSYGGVGGYGRGRCACGELSDWLRSANMRKAWHREHKAETAAKEDA